MKVSEFFLFLITSFLLVCNASAGCGKEIKEYYQCFRNMFDSRLGPYTRGIDFEDFQKHISSCLTSNGCKDLKLETRKEILQRSGAKNDLPDDLTKMKEVKSKIRHRLRDDIEKCVQKQLDGDFKLPIEKPTDYVDFPIDDVLLNDIYIPALVNALRNKTICPESAKATKCIGDLFDLFEDRKRFCQNPFELIINRVTVRAKACEEFGCLKKSGKCKSEVDNGVQLICDCTRNETDVSISFTQELMEHIPEIQNSTASTIVADAMRQVSENTCRLEAFTRDDPCQGKLQTEKRVKRGVCLHS